MKSFIGTQQDFKGDRLCPACWNGHHDKCMQRLGTGACWCPCLEKPARKPVAGAVPEQKKFDAPAIEVK